MKLTNKNNVSLNQTQKLNFGPQQPLVTQGELSVLNKNLDWDKQLEIYNFQAMFLFNNLLFNNNGKSRINPTLSRILDSDDLLFVNKKQNEIMKGGKVIIYFNLNRKLSFLLIPEINLKETFVFKFNNKPNGGYFLPMSSLAFLLPETFKKSLKTPIDLSCIWFDGSISEQNFLTMTKLLNIDIISKFLIEIIANTTTITNYDLYLNIFISYWMENNLLFSKIKVNSLIRDYYKILVINVSNSNVILALIVSSSLDIMSKEKDLGLVDLEFTGFCLSPEFYINYTQYFIIIASANFLKFILLIKAVFLNWYILTTMTEKLMVLFIISFYLAAFFRIF
jgi:hypothetical protein